MLQKCCNNIVVIIYNALVPQRTMEDACLGITKLTNNETCNLVQI